MQLNYLIKLMKMVMEKFLNDELLNGLQYFLESDGEKLKNDINLIFNNIDINSIDINKYENNLKNAKNYKEGIDNTINQYINEIENQKKLLIQNFGNFKI